MKTLPKTYDPKEAEPRWQKAWEESRTYAWRDDLPRESTYVIDTPPPTVSGVLHMGHIFSYTQADFVARYQRMSGKDVFYPMGFDDNGLPTERLVEKTRKVRAVDVGREAFIALCQEVSKEYEDQFRDMFKSVALSVDWSQEYQTISADSRRISQMSFLDLFAKDQVYRDFRPTYWDWVDQTAIAQAEIEDKEIPSTENYITFRICDEYKTPIGDIEIMTTRPELLGACVAVMAHPDEVKNITNGKGYFVEVPLFGYLVPLIADDKVDKNKGTGFVMCCTFGDDTDKEWWRKYKLPTKAILGKDGRLNFDSVIPAKAGIQANPQTPALPDGMDPGLRRDDAAGLLQGLKIKPAREKTLELLQAEGALLKQTPITHTVKCAERSGTPIEIIPTQQWYVRIMDKKDALLAKGNACNWHPEFMHIRLNQWIEGLKEDWCISRQRFFGVPFPIWYSKRAGEEGKILVADASRLPADPLVDLPAGYTREEVEADRDVMDTWATSSVSPQINARAITSSLRGEAEAIQNWIATQLRCSR